MTILQGLPAVTGIDCATNAGSHSTNAAQMKSNTESLVKNC